MQAAREAGALIRAAWNEPRQIDEKSSAADLVTQTDRQCEEAIKRTLSDAFPTYRFIGEEETAALGRVPELTDDPSWLVDPVDGTTSFVHRFPFCCVSIALAVEKKLVVGVVYNPVLDELYVVPDRRDEGIGSTIIEHLFALADERASARRMGQHRSGGAAPDPQYPWRTTIYGSKGTLKLDVN